MARPYRERRSLRAVHRGRHVDNDSGTVTIRSGGRDERLTVQIGLRGNRYTEIRSGLTDGQTVVLGQS